MLLAARRGRAVDGGGAVPPTQKISRHHMRQPNARPALPPAPLKHDSVSLSTQCCRQTAQLRPQQHTTARQLFGNACAHTPLPPSPSDLHTPPPDDAIDVDDEFGDASGGDDDDGGASDSDAPSSTRDDATPRPPATPATAPGLTGAKGDAMARAFAKVMAADSRSGAAAVLASSKSVAKRAADGAGEAAVDAAARKLRKEMRRRGHAVSVVGGGDGSE